VVFGPRVTLATHIARILRASNDRDDFSRLVTSRLAYAKYETVRDRMKTAADHVGAIFVDVGAIQGARSFDALTSWGSVAYFDSGHFTVEGSMEFAARLRNEMPNLFGNLPLAHY
jgi:hypothetical protein